MPVMSNSHDINRDILNISFLANFSPLIRIPASKVFVCSYNLQLLQRSIYFLCYFSLHAVRHTTERCVTNISLDCMSQNQDYYLHTVTFGKCCSYIASWTPPKGGNTGTPRKCSNSPFAKLSSSQS